MRQESHQDGHDGEAETAVDRLLADTDVQAFAAWRKLTRRPLRKKSLNSWARTIIRLEASRRAAFGKKSWKQIPTKTIAYELVSPLVDEGTGRDGGELSENSKRLRYDAMNAYFKFLIDTEELAANPCLKLARPGNRPAEQPWLTPHDDTLLALCEKTTLELGLYTLARGVGLRVGEIKALEDDDVVLRGAQPIVRVRSGKTASAIRDVPLSPSVVELLSSYRRQRARELPAVESDKFIRTETGQISEQWIWVTIKKLAIKAGVVERDGKGQPKLNDKGEQFTRIGPHALRRTWGSALYRDGLGSHIFSALMGHASTRVTEESYVKLMTDERRAQITSSLEAGALALAADLNDLGKKARDKNDRRDESALKSQIDHLRRLLEAAEQTLDDNPEDDRLAA